MRITVFTPTFNRGYIISNLYNSLCKQSFKDFEWVVIDDGSVDNTKEIFDDILNNDNSFDIRYIKTENRGKHRAINKGVELAKGELFFIVDSDDYLPENSLEIIDKVEKSIEGKSSFCGVCGIKSYDVKNNVGSTFEGDYLDITCLERPKYNINGDKAEVFYTNILKMYPFPEFEGEFFLTECVVWDKIAYDGFKMRFFNETVYFCEYLEDGLSRNKFDIYKVNPRGQGLYLFQSAKYQKIKGLEKWNKFLEYFYMHRDNLSFIKISKYLHYNPLLLYIRLFILRIFYRLYRNFK